MPDEPNNELRIALWPARNREIGDNRPYLTGKVMVKGVEYFVTLWKRETHSTSEPPLSGELSEVKPLEV
jgi:hypothetical protein